MKTILLSLLLFFVSSLTMAQVWAPSGATWYYDLIIMAKAGYVKIQYIGDTTIGGKSCKTLKKEIHEYDWIDHTYATILLGYEYTYFENNIVYYLRYGQFFKLYDFNSVAGNSWEVAGWEQNNPCDSTGMINVESTGTTTINTFSLKYLHVLPGQNSTWDLSDTIIERIGSLGYMFPEPICVVDLVEGGPLRCYSDDAFGLYKRGYALTCDYINGIDKIIPGSNYVKIYPVPATTTLTLEIIKQVKGNTRVEISDILGKRIKIIETDKLTEIIDVRDLKAGIYFISVTDQSGFFWNRKIIKNIP